MIRLAGVQQQGSGFVVLLDAPHLGATVWDLDVFITNLRGELLRDVARYLRINVKSRTKVDAIRHDMRNVLVAMVDLKERTGLDMLADMLSLDGRTPAKVVEVAPVVKEVTPTTDLFDRARSLGYDTQAAARVADCWKNWNQVYDPCATHPNHSVSTDHQGYAVDGCEACRVIELSDAAGFVSKLIPTGPVNPCNSCRINEATSPLEVGGPFIGSIMSVAKSPLIMLCESCHAAVLDSVEEGDDSTEVWCVWADRNMPTTQTPRVVIKSSSTKYAMIDCEDRAYALARELCPGYVIPVAGYVVPDPRKRVAYDVYTPLSGSFVTEMTRGEAASLRWKHIDDARVRIAPRLTFELVDLTGRIASAESEEVFDVSPDGVTGPVYNRNFRHKIVRFPDSSRCCEKGAGHPGHLHMSAVPSVISAHPGVPVIRIECRIGQILTIDGVKYELINQRYADPLLVPVDHMPL